MKHNLNETLKAAIKTHAIHAYPAEACGLIMLVNGAPVVFPTDNESETPQESFVVPAQAYADALNSGQLCGYYHSHPRGTVKFSEADKQVAEKIKLPLIVYSVTQDDYDEYMPNGYVAPLEGRSFELGTHDCAGLVIDYYRQKLGIALESFGRVGTFVTSGFPDIQDYLKRNSLSVVTAPKQHDIVLMRIGGGSKAFCNHAGIIIEPGVMLHQLISQRSGRVVYGGYWAAMTRHILRHNTRV